MIDKLLRRNRQSSQKSLAKTLALYTFFISITVLTTIVCLSILLIYQNQTRAITSNQSFISESAANTVKAFVQDKVNDLTSAVQFNYLSGVTTTDSYSTLEKLLGLQPAFNQVAIMNAAQQQIGQASRLPHLYTPGITAGIDTNQLFQTVKQDKTFISQVYIDPSSSEPEVLIAVPINSIYTGFSGALLAETNLTFMWSTVANIKDGAHGLAYVVDNHGTLIAAADTTRVLKHENLSKLTVVKQFLQGGGSSGNTNSYTARGFNGDEVVSTYASLGMPNWAVVTQIPVAEAYAPLIKDVIISLAIIVVGVLVSVLAAIWVIAEHVSKPLTLLRDAAIRLGQGDLTARVSISGYSEISELGKTFNFMAIGLTESTARVREEHAKLEASIDSLKVGFLIIDPDGNVLTNPATRTILDQSKHGSILPTNATEILSLEVIDAKLGPSIGLKAKIDKALRASQSIEIKAIDYDSRVLRIFIAPITSTDTPTTSLGTVVLMEDITEEQLLERSKDEFFSIASHELRTPLTAIRGNTSMVLNYYSEILKDPNLKEMITDVHESSIRLIEIVNDFLDLSRLEQGKMKFSYEVINIEEIIESVVYEMKAVLNEKNLSLKLDKMVLGATPQVWADKNRLKQVIFNLVGNSAKFTDQGSISVTASVDRDFVKVLISDTGRGMSPEDQQLLFHKFQQATSSLLTRDTTRGTGLGLYISKMIIEIMGGTIKLEQSKEGEGTTFSFTVPIATPEHQAATRQANESTDTKTGLTTREKLH